MSAFQVLCTMVPTRKGRQGLERFRSGPSNCVALWAASQPMAALACTPG